MLEFGDIGFIRVIWTKRKCIPSKKYYFINYKISSAYSPASDVSSVGSFQCYGGLISVFSKMLHPLHI